MNNEIHNQLMLISGNRIYFYFICSFGSDIKYIQLGTWSIATYKEKQKKQHQQNQDIL